MSDHYPYQCQRCECRRCDALEEAVKDLSERLHKLETIEARALNHARLRCAIDGGEVITMRDMARRKSVNKHTVEDWAARPDFPHFVEQGGGRRARKWNAAEFERWYQQYKASSYKAAHAAIKRGEEP